MQCCLIQKSIPLATMASATSLISVSLILHRKKFQLLGIGQQKDVRHSTLVLVCQHGRWSQLHLFHPMAGVRPTPLFRAHALAASMARREIWIIIPDLDTELFSGTVLIDSAGSERDSWS